MELRGMVALVTEAAERALAGDTPPAKKPAAKPARAARKRRARA